MGSSNRAGIPNGSEDPDSQVIFEGLCKAIRAGIKSAQITSSPEGQQQAGELLSLELSRSLASSTALAPELKAAILAAFDIGQEEGLALAWRTAQGMAAVTSDKWVEQQARSILENIDLSGRLAEMSAEEIDEENMLLKGLEEGEGVQARAEADGSFRVHSELRHDVVASSLYRFIAVADEGEAMLFVRYFGTDELVQVPAHLLPAAKDFMRVAAPKIKKWRKER